MRESSGWAFEELNRIHFLRSDIYFIGGFGTVAWIDVKEYEALQPDKIAVDGGEQNLKVCVMPYQSLFGTFLSFNYSLQPCDAICKLIPTASEIFIFAIVVVELGYNNSLHIDLCWI